MVTPLHNRRFGRRNATTAGASALLVGVLFLYPASTNSVSAHTTAPGTAPAGIVAAPVQPQARASSAVSAKGGAPTAGTTKSPSTTRSATPVTVNGTAVQTRYGPVQVQLQISGSKIISATAIDYPRSNGRDQRINSRAIPVLQRETLSAQSAQVDTVSGATYTSDGYRGSLQSALDAAHL